VESFESALGQARILYHGKPRITVASTLNYLGMALRRAGKSKESLPCSQEAKEIMDKMLGPDNLHPMTSRILENLIRVYQDLGDLGKAKEYSIKAVDIDRKNPKTKNECPCLVFSLFELSKICEALREQNEALKHLEEAREIAKGAGCKHAIVVEVLVKLVTKYFCMMSFAKCRTCLDEALEIGKTFSEDNATPTMQFLLNLQKQFGYRPLGLFS
jgi:tetratricopeptide (TPR) repeat protein